MKKWLIALICIISLGLVTACSGGKVGEKKDEPKTEQTEDDTKEESEEVADFRNVDITYEKETNSLEVKGEAIATNPHIYYKVEQLGEELVSEQEIELSSERKWEEIELSLPVSEMKDEEEAVIFIFYTKDEAGEPVKPNHHFPANLIQMREY